MLILDFYVDEPACFGVPPYLSPYCRYVAGALVSAGVPAKKIDYMTVDVWRARGKELATESELVLLIAGATVPGKYLGGRIGTVTEILELLEYRQKHQPGGLTLIGGPIRFASREIRTQISARGGYLVRGDIELYANLLGSAAGRMRAALAAIVERRGAGLGDRRTYPGQVDRWAPAGAFLSEQHPYYPHLILEIETYRGCTRNVFCSFCTEAFYGRPEFRATEAILDEVRELYQKGNRNFRLGRQADLMTYLPDMDDFQNSFPRPRPQNLRALYGGIRSVAPGLSMLHLDNINPGLIATFPVESREIIRIISAHNTPGDTAAMGLESVDDLVIQKNDLKCNAAEARQAIEITNEFGAQRTNGIPHLLPGLNFIHGLPGEDDKTFEKNYNFLKSIKESGLLLRRINIRQVVTYENTKVERLQSEGSASNNPQASKKVNKYKKRSDRKRGEQVITEKFLYYRHKIRTEIDRPMLMACYPPGTIVRGVLPEGRNQGFILGRPPGSYPVTFKIPDDDPTALQAFEIMRAAELDHIGQAMQALDVIVVGAEERSLVGLTYPIAINQIGRKALQKIPGLGKKRAMRVFEARPIADYDSLIAILEDQPLGRAADYNFSRISSSALQAMAQSARERF